MDNCNHGTNVIACPMCAVDRLIKERDEARAEVERLRDVLRGLAHWVSNLATDDQLDRPAYKTSKSGREWLGDALEFARTDFADKKEKKQ